MAERIDVTTEESPDGADHYGLGLAVSPVITTLVGFMRLKS
jgi:hypothetical protein